MSQALTLFYSKIMHDVDESLANILVIERVRKILRRLQQRLQIKVGLLMAELLKTAKSTMVWATMEDDRENNLISCITDDFSTKPSRP